MFYHIIHILYIRSHFSTLIAFSALFLGAMSTRSTCFLLLFLIGICAGCANITAPTGGKRDKIPPKLLTITPADSQLNARPKRVDMTFDEYITVSDVSKEVQISPMLSVDPTVTGLNKHVTVKIVDSLLDSNTTYRLSFGNSIKDLHEGNAFAKYTYTFSTGSYFDSLELRGSVINAASGLPDTGSIVVVLYSGREGDSAVIRHKPKYITHADKNGSFVFKGLPRRRYRIYALKDGNGNLIYDGPAAGDMIAFIDHVITPGDTDMAPVNMRLFTEVPDSATKKTMDSTASKKPGFGKAKKTAEDAGLTYSVELDTSNINKRTYNINKPISITFTKQPLLNKDKIRLTYDSSGITVTPDVDITLDTFHVVRIATAWSQNMVYTLRLVKGFAKDTGNKDVLPARFSFRTYEDEDYGKITVNLPNKYYATQYVLQVTSDKDTVYRQPITDTVVALTRLKPAKYTFSVIADKNGNGRWDTGDLFGKLQPEEVIPYREVLNLRANFELIVDFEQQVQDKKTRMGDLKDKK
jgi:uncharacterized protein (DUF2141 family)